MAHPPQRTYPQYAPPQPGYPPPSGPSYPPQQDPQRFYTPGPQGRLPGELRSVIRSNRDLGDYPTSSPPPNFQRQGQGTPAPFYVAGSEIPSTSGQTPAPQNQSYPHRPAGGPPSPRLPSAGKAPAPINTSPPAQPAGQYTAYSQPPGQRPTSTYGAQELATSVYDSPIAPHNQNNPQSAATYTSSVYSQDDPYNAASPSGNQPSTSTVQPPVPFTQPAPPPGSQAAQPQYQSYQPSQSQQPLYDGPGPGSSGAGRPPAGMSPPPLQPGGPGFDARQSLPSQAGGVPPQYKPYVPPPASEPSAPGPADYYRQASGNVY